MTSVTDICNRSLQVIGTRTTVTDAELANGDTNEAVQFNLIYANNRDDLARLAPWNCVMKVANLTYISSLPGTPENTSASTALWTPGQPAPPWSYEYQFPVDCLRAVQLIPANATLQGNAPVGIGVGAVGQQWFGPPPKFRVQTDLFYPVTAAAVVAGGTGYAVGDIITLPIGPTTSAPIGAPVQLRVATAPAGVVATVTVVNVIMGETTPKGGSYFAPQTGTIAQDTTTGSGTGATFTLTFGDQGDQRVILTNQEYATLAYCRQITNPNVWDTLFQTALINTVAADLIMALRGDSALANKMVDKVNDAIEQARSIDGNEGFIVNDVTPDFIRTRGIAYEGLVTGPFSNFDWGGGWPSFA
jgi:hypothetical protein